MSGYQFIREQAAQNVPDELRERAQWVGWSLIQGEGDAKPRKVPLDPKAAPRFEGRVASHSNPETWGTFDETCEGTEKYGFTGIGYVFAADDPYCGFDFDRVRRPVTITARDGSISVESFVIDSGAQVAIDKIAPYGYCEISPSGTGLHIILRGTLPRKQAKRTMPGGWSVEAYSAERYFTITGEKWGAS